MARTTKYYGNKTKDGAKQTRTKKEKGHKAIKRTKTKKNYRKAGSFDRPGD